MAWTDYYSGQNYEPGFSALVGGVQKQMAIAAANKAGAQKLRIDQQTADDEHAKAGLDRAKTMHDDGLSVVPQNSGAPGGLTPPQMAAPNLDSDVLGNPAGAVGSFVQRQPVSGTPMDEHIPGGLPPAPHLGIGGRIAAIGHKLFHSTPPKPDVQYAATGPTVQQQIESGHDATTLEANRNTVDGAFARNHEDNTTNTGIATGHDRAGIIEALIRAKSSMAERMQMSGEATRWHYADMLQKRLHSIDMRFMGLWGSPTLGDNEKTALNEERTRLTTQLEGMLNLKGGSLTGVNFSGEEPGNQTQGGVGSALGNGYSGGNLPAEDDPDWMAARKAAGIP